MKMHSASTLVALGALTLASFGQDAAPQSYVRSGTRGAEIRNLPDPEGISLGKSEPGDLVAVFRERAGWYEVEVPGGFPVWVYGRYLRATDNAHIYEVTGDGINLRPRPSRDVANFPLSGRLYTGDRVRSIERNDTALPLAEDWVRIWSPPGIHAWVAGADTVALSSGEDGAALWQAALGGLNENRGVPAPASAPVTKPTAGAANAAVTTPAAQPGAPEEVALAALDLASQMLTEARRIEAPDFGAVRAAYGRVLELAPAGVAARLARQGLETVDALEAAASIRGELEIERQRREAELLVRQEEIWEKSRAKDPLVGRFDGRGVLERRTMAGEAPRFFLRRGGADAFELTCSSARYDLNLFAGYEIGVVGAADGDVRMLDCERLFVLSGR